MKEKNYGFTFKKNLGKAEFIDESDYEPILRNLNRVGKVVDVIYEKDKKGRLHIHGIVTFTRSPLFRMLCPKYYHSYFEELYDQAGWNRYMMKDQKIDNSQYMF